MSNDCPYKLLGVTPRSTPAEIRSAYKRLALTLHPDKAAAAARPAATIAFQKLNAAYHLLSKQFNLQKTKPQKFIFKDPRFGSAYFPPSGNGPEFFAFYEYFFNQIHKQELNFASFSNISAPPSPPPMGDGNCTYDVTLEFYNYWLRFSTVLDFGWVAGDVEVERREYEESVRKVARHLMGNDGRVCRVRERRRVCAKMMATAAKAMAYAAERMVEEGGDQDVAVKMAAFAAQRAATAATMVGSENWKQYFEWWTK